MRVIIEAGNHKREIVGPFNLCASQDDLMRIQDMITAWLGRHPETGGLAYGWLHVTEAPAEAPSHPDMAPEPWDGAETPDMQTTGTADSRDDTTGIAEAHRVRRCDVPVAIDVMEENSAIRWSGCCYRNAGHSGEHLAKVIM